MKLIFIITSVAMGITPLLPVKFNLTANTIAKHSNPPDIIIINAFDAMNIKARDNKKDLLQQLTDSLKEYLALEAKTQYGKHAKVVPNMLLKIAQLDSVVYTLIAREKAKHAILIWSLDVFFETTGSREEEDSEGKTRTYAAYDMCAKAEYSLYDAKNLLKQSQVENCNFFTERSVGKRFFITIGPDIVGKKKHTFGTVANNANRYIYQVATFLNSD